MDPRPLAAVRILLAVCVLLDFARVIQLGLTSHLFRTFDDGGLSRIQDPHMVITAWLGPAAGPTAMVVTMVCMVFIAAGVWTRPAIVVGVLAYAQLGHLFPPGDRAIDRMIRTGLLILLFSGAHKCWTLRRHPAAQRIAAWPADLIKFVLAMMYLSAGIAKLIQQPGWILPDRGPPLLRIVTDPLAAHLDPAFWAQWPLMFRLGSWATIALELSALLLLTRYARYWAVVGVIMHLGIALSMELGMFSWGMLAFYPVLLEPWFTRWLDRR